MLVLRVAALIILTHVIIFIPRLLLNIRRRSGCINLTGRENYHANTIISGNVALVYQFANDVLLEIEFVQFEAIGTGKDVGQQLVGGVLYLAYPFESSEEPRYHICVNASTDLPRELLDEKDLLFITQRLDKAT